MPNTQFIAVLYMIMSMVSYQISASFAKQLMTVLDPFSVVTLRLCFAAIMIIVMFRSWKILKRLPYLQWRHLLLYSASVCLMNVLFYASLGRLPQGIAVGLEFLGPLALALLSVQRRSDLVWVLLAIAGIALMVPWQQATEHNFSFLGAAFALGAGCCWASYIYFGQKVARQNIGMHGLSIAISLSAAVLLPISLWHNPDAVLNTQYWKPALLIALLATAIPYALDLLALRQLSKLSYGTLSSLSPAIAAIAGMLLLKEHITFWQSLALLCIMTASVGVTFRAARKPAPETS
ncbi:EamA family transporter [Acinetobacter larvae]|uniref:EamA family transporter n=1 Tax=Acinetobacter larvae TaxID=1789224 RepID=A0A1B2M3V3_9GAMM|nr:EamA family transporter [Acinetobacter larvae]AOA59821.1 EamA family transporter [Acinetobacter larvae]